MISFFGILWMKLEEVAEYFCRIEALAHLARKLNMVVAVEENLQSVGDEEIHYSLRGVDLLLDNHQRKVDPGVHVAISMLLRILPLMVRKVAVMPFHSYDFVLTASSNI